MKAANDAPKYHLIYLDYERKWKTVDHKKYIEIDPPKGLIDLNDGEPLKGIEEYDLFIVVTMYNEDWSKFDKTLEGIYENLASFNAGEKIAVVVIADGLEIFLKMLEDEKANKYYKPLFDLDKIYEYFINKKWEKQGKINEDNKDNKDYKDDKAWKEKLIKKTFKKKFKNNDPGYNNSLKRSCKIAGISHKRQGEMLEDNIEVAHCFINTIKFTRSSVTNDLKVFFCVKHENKRKLNSHLWFFYGFCKVNPKYCMLIDTGTIPQKESLYLLYQKLTNDNVAGVCGEIIPYSDQETYFSIWYHAQVVEYKFSHILDKSSESLFGYITVLPGAFSAYKFEALMCNSKSDPEEKNRSPLWKHYFKSLRAPWKMDCYNANIYLAEDRVLCLALIGLQSKKYILKYVREAKALTDPPSSLSDFLKQRRRWINGSWFALIDSIFNCEKQIWGSGHHCWRKCFFSLQIFYYFLNVIYSFFMVGGSFLFLSICLRHQYHVPGTTQHSDLGIFVLSCYLALIIVIFILSIGSEESKSEKAFFLLFLLFLQYISFHLFI